MKRLGATVLLLLISGLALGATSLSDSASESFDPLLLNIRMSSTSVSPPSTMVKETWTLDGYRVGRLGAHDPRSAIIDDDQHHRLMVISATEDGLVRVYRLGDVPVDVGTHLPFVTTCAQSRGCRHARMDPAGEIGCLAVCLLESLKE